MAESSNMESGNGRVEHEEARAEKRKHEDDERYSGSSPLLKKIKESSSGDWKDDDILSSRLEKRDSKEVVNGSIASLETVEYDVNGHDGQESSEYIDKRNGHGNQSSKNDPLDNDVKTISEFLGLSGKEDLIKAKLVKVRNDPNRIDVVSAQLLEEGSLSNTEGESSDEIKPPENGVNEKGDNGNEMAKMLKDIEEVCRILKKKKPDSKFDPNTAYMLLESNSKHSNRIELVVNMILKSLEPEAKEEPGPSGETDDIIDVFKEVEILMKKFPKADANHVYALLECRQKDKNRLQSVSDILSEKNNETDVIVIESDDNVNAEDAQPTGRTPQGRGRVLDESIVANDPIYKDMLKISKIFPEIDKNEIYALCEMYHDKSNRADLVTADLLNAREGSQNSNQDLNESVDEIREVTKKDSSQKSSKGAGSSSKDAATTSAPKLDPQAQLQLDLENITAVVPDCDPDFIYNMLEQRFLDPQRVENISAQLLENKNYPKLKDRIEKEKKQAHVRRIKNMEFNMEEFLATFPDPCTVFYDETKQVTDAYKSHAIIQLKNTFPTMHCNYVQEVFNTHKEHFTPSLRQLELEASTYDPNQRDRRRRKGHKKKFRQSPRTNNWHMPDNPDEYFYKELMFTKHEQRIKDYIKEKEESKKRRLEEARQTNSLYECTCCYDDELLLEDLCSCPDGHMYCKECLKRSTESRIGEGQIDFPCFDDKCKMTFQIKDIKEVVSNQLFSNLLKKIAEEEIRQADIPDLETCPFCTFATIMPNKEDKIFKCQSPDCLKESCRLCKEPNHIPLRCNEVEKKGETDMRTFIENKITEAMIRTCWKCKKRFFKTEGCNKMTCPCGASMCYVCQKPITGYEHFNGKEASCPADTDVRKLHMDEMEKAGKLAREKYQKDHPEMAGKSLEHDPFNQLAKNMKGNAEAANNAIFADALFRVYEDDGDEDDDNYYDRQSDDDDDLSGSEDENEEDVPRWMNYY